MEAGTEWPFPPTSFPETGLTPDPDFELVFVGPSYHRKGHATALVQHAAAIADALGYESYLDADLDVKALYLKQGYVERTDIDSTSIMKPMVRPARGETGVGNVSRQIS